MEICQYIDINKYDIQEFTTWKFVNTYLINMVSTEFTRIYHMEICQYILINMVSQNLPLGNLSIHINKYGIPEFTTEICQYILINMVSQNLPHGNLSIHINKYGIPEFTTWKFVNTY